MKWPSKVVVKISSTLVQRTHTGLACGCQGGLVPPGFVWLSQSRLLTRLKAGKRSEFGAEIMYFVHGRLKCGKNIGGGSILRGAEMRWAVRVEVSLKSFQPGRWILSVFSWKCRFLIEELCGCSINDLLIVAILQHNPSSSAGDGLGGDSATNSCYCCWNVAWILTYLKYKCWLKFP